MINTTKSRQLCEVVTLTTNNLTQTKIKTKYQLKELQNISRYPRLYVCDMQDDCIHK